jgi:hypothetical protein
MKNKILKLGRTHLQDAIPTTLGKEFGAYANNIKKHQDNIKNISHLSLVLNLGGTAIGNSINANPVYIALVGSTDQSLSGTGVFSMLNVNKASGNVLMTGNVTINNTLKGTVSGNFVNSGGVLRLGTGAGVNVVTNFEGTVDDATINCNILTLNKDLNILDDLTFTLVQDRIDGGAANLEIKVTGDISIADANGWALNANPVYVALVGNTNQSLRQIKRIRRPNPRLNRNHTPKKGGT